MNSHYDDGEMTTEEIEEYLSLPLEKRVTKMKEYMDRLFEKQPQIKERFEYSGRMITEAILFPREETEEQKIAERKLEESIENYKNTHKKEIEENSRKLKKALKKYHQSS